MRYVTKDFKHVLGSGYRLTLNGSNPLDVIIAGLEKKNGKVNVVKFKVIKEKGKKNTKIEICLNSGKRYDLEDRISLRNHNNQITLSYPVPEYVAKPRNYSRY